MRHTRSSASQFAHAFPHRLRRLVLHVRGLFWKRSHLTVRSSPDGLVIGSVADPELDMSLMSVRGTVTSLQLDALESAMRSIDDGTILHLDLTDAVFPDPSAFTEFESLVDALEDRGVRIRIVGLRPVVPAPQD